MAKVDYQFSYAIKKQRNFKLFTNIIFVVFLIAFVTILLNFVLFPVRQTSISMNPDLPENSFAMISKIGKNFQRGDVVLIQNQNEKPESKLKVITNSAVSFITGQQIDISNRNSNPALNEKIRRIVGMPGDTFYMRDYVLYIKPKGEKHFLTEFEISKKNYNVSFLMPPSGWDSSIGVAGSFDEITLKENEYFVLSDMRISSDDSRLWGAITNKNIKGKILFSYFPVSKFKFF